MENLNNGEKHQKEELENLRQIIENSSRLNRAYAVFVISYATYVLVATFSIKDIQFLFPELGVKLPILNINLNLDAFAIVAPLLLMAFYIGLVLNLGEHVKLLLEYKKKIENLDEKENYYLRHPIIPFMVDMAVLKGGLTGWLFRIISYFLLIFYPLIVLFIVYKVFARYQSSAITYIEFAFVFIASGFFIGLFSFKYLWRKFKNLIHFFKFFKLNKQFYVEFLKSVFKSFIAVIKLFVILCIQ